MKNDDLAQEVMLTLLEGPEALLEDRIDDLIKVYGKKLPASNPQMARGMIDMWAAYDPHPRKKYLPWIVKQVAQKQLTPDDHTLDHLSDQLRAYERLLKIPEFTGNKDIFAYTWPAFDAEINKNINLRSQSEREREAKAAKKRGLGKGEGTAGVTVIAEQGPYTLLEIKDAVSLSWWSWKAYDRDFNPNWKQATIPPPKNTSDADIRDGKWCVRYPTYGLNYIQDETSGAFYLVLKNGGPYVGILLDGGQWKDLDNHSISVSIAEEIYPVVKGLLDAYAKSGKVLGWEGEVFVNLRFVHGEVKPGEKFGSVNLSGTSVRALPQGCTYAALDITKTQITEIPEGSVIEKLNAANSQLMVIAPNASITVSLNVSNTPIRTLPPGLTLNTLNITGCKNIVLPDKLTVKETFHMEGSSVTDIPEGVTVGESMTWSEPMTLEKVKDVFYRACLPKMYKSFLEKPQIAEKTPQAQKKAWDKFAIKLRGFFQTDPAMEKTIRATYAYKKPSESESE